jgi:hypothetical protein
MLHRNVKAKTNIMNRIVFILSLVIILILGRAMQLTNITGYGLIVIFLGSIVVIARRVYLKMRPWWGGKLRDIPNYFKRN